MGKSCIGIEPLHVLLDFVRGKKNTSYTMGIWLFMYIWLSIDDICTIKMYLWFYFEVFMFTKKIKQNFNIEVITPLS